MTARDNIVIRLNANKEGQYLWLVEYKQNKQIEVMVFDTFEEVSRFVEGELLV